MPCKSVQWMLEEEQIILTDSFEDRREEIWKFVLSQHPDSYDGNLLVLKAFNIDSLNMNIIKYSRIVTLERHGEHLRPYGTIGMQITVFSPDRKYILVGQRARSVMYCPRYFSAPGGMLEVLNAEGSSEEACLREFNEEVELNILDDMILHAITSEINGTAGVVFILTGTAKSVQDIEMLVKGNEEWEGNHLKWYSVQDLETFTYSNSLESILFAKEELL